MGYALIDDHGYRYGVGIVLVNNQGQILLANRKGMVDAWQFPQGGIDHGESPERAMFRELEEELGLTPDTVKILSVTQDWLSYDLPENYRRYYSSPLCIGQKQKWFLLQLVEADHMIALDQTLTPEFDYWRWADLIEPMRYVVFFKGQVYEQVLSLFQPIIENIKNHSNQ